MTLIGRPRFLGTSVVFSLGLSAMSFLGRPTFFLVGKDDASSIDDACVNHSLKCVETFKHQKYRYIFILPILSMPVMYIGQLKFHWGIILTCPGMLKL